MTRLRSGIALLLIFAIAACGSDVTAPKVQVPTALLVVAGDAQAIVVGSAVTTLPIVRLVDADGVAIAGATVTFSVGSGGGSVTGASTTTDATGAAKVGGWTMGTTAGQNTLVATSGSLTATFNATGTAARAFSITPVSGKDQTATVGSNVAIAPSVAVRDTFANPVAGVVVTFSIANGGGSVIGATATSDASGIATLGSWKLGTVVGANSLTVTSGTLTANFTATALVGPAAKVIALAGDNQTANANAALSVAPSVKITDAFDNPIPNVAVTFVADRDAVVTGATQMTNAVGVATAGGWTLGAGPGTYSLQAKVGSLAASFAATGIAVPLDPPPPLSAPPVPVSLSAERFSMLSSGIVGTSGGQSHACAIDINGVAYCWGANTGDIGDGTTTTRTTATVVSGSQRFVQISAGYSHTCALTASGAAYCWGTNFNGELGIGGTDTDPQLTPVPVTGGLVFQTVVAGGNFSCGLTVAGKVYCWGSNFMSKLGNGDAAFSQRGPGPVSGSLNFVALVAGFNDACALTNGGKAYCWGGGSPYWGTIGDGTATVPDPRPADDPLWVRTRNVPTAVSGNIVFSKLSAGAFSTCGLTPVGDAYCWGMIGNNQFGTPPNTASGVPVAVITTAKFVDIAVGGQHACARLANNSVLCWGANFDGQFGNGSTAAATSPVYSALGTSWTSIAAGDQNTCGIDTGQHIYCWGNNAWGQVGDGTIGTRRTVPVPVIFP